MAHVRESHRHKVTNVAAAGLCGFDTGCDGLQMVGELRHRQMSVAAVLQCARNKQKPARSCPAGLGLFSAQRHVVLGGHDPQMTC